MTSGSGLGDAAMDISTELTDGSDQSKAICWFLKGRKAAKQGSLKHGEDLWPAADAEGVVRAGMEDGHLCSAQHSGIAAEQKADASNSKLSSRSAEDSSPSCTQLIGI